MRKCDIPLVKALYNDNAFCLLWYGEQQDIVFNCYMPGSSMMWNSSNALPTVENTLPEFEFGYYS